MVRVQGTMERNDNGRFRIARLDVTLTPTVEGEPEARCDRCLGLFEEFCIVTQSVRDGIEVDVRVEPDFVPAPGDPAQPRAEAAAAGSAPSRWRLTRGAGWVIFTAPLSGVRRGATPR